MTILNGQPTLSKQKSTACKLIQGSLKFWIPSCGFRIPGTGFWILDSLPGVRSTSKNSSNSGTRVPYMGRRKRDSRARASLHPLFLRRLPKRRACSPANFGRTFWGPDICPVLCVNFCNCYNLEVFLSIWGNISCINLIFAFKLLCVIASQKK